MMLKKQISLLILCSVVFTTVESAERGLSRNVSPATTSVVQGEYHALVIGNNKYQDPLKVWLPLKTAVNDALAVDKMLRTKYGFSEVTLLKDATRRQILSALNQLLSRIKKNDSVLVYYAGHGWRNEITKEAFWVPVDAEGEEDSFYLSNVRIKEKLSVIASIANHTLLISDSCFSGSLLDVNRGISSNPGSLSDAYIRKVAKRRSVQILAAGGKEFVDDNYRGSGHSPFTYFLLKELDTNVDKHVTLARLALQVEQLVARNATQTPQSGALRLAGDEGGQFIFNLAHVPPKIATQAIVQPAQTTAINEAEFSDWKKINQESPKELLAYISLYPNGSIAEVAQIKYKAQLNKIDALLDLANDDIKRGRYISPVKRNAKYRYKTILELDRENRAAINGLKKLVKRMLSRVKVKIKRRHYTEAAEILSFAEEIDPGLPQISRFRKIINNRLQRESKKNNVLKKKKIIKNEIPTSRPVSRDVLIAPPPSF